MRLAPIVIVLLAGPPSAGAATLRGTLVEARSGDVVVGASVIARRDGDGAQTTVLSGSDGTYLAVLAPGTYTLVVVHEGSYFERHDVVVPEGDGVVDEARFALERQSITDEYSVDYAPSLRTVPAPVTFHAGGGDGLHVLWRRDHRGVDALDARIRADRTAATVDHGVRLAGSAPIAFELLGEHDTYSYAAPIAQAGASGGVAALTTLHGANPSEATARLALGRQSRLAATAAGALWRNHLWSAGGVALEQRDGGLDAQGMGNLVARLDDRRELGSTFVISTAPDRGLDAWIDSRARITDDDDRRKTEVGLTGQALFAGDVGPTTRTVAATAPLDVDRIGGRLIVDQRIGSRHRLTAGGEVGGGRADDARHTDVRAFAGDRWEPRNTLSIEAGVRWDRRTLGGAVAEVWSPRLSFVWNADDTGAALVFGSAERTAHLDEERFGAWRDGPIATDTALLGYRRRWGHALWASVAARTRRDPQTGDAAGGVEGALRWDDPDAHVIATATASTLEEAATATVAWSCGCERDRLSVAAIARATPDAFGWAAQAGVTHAGLQLAVELHDLDDRDDRTARLVLSSTW